MIFRRRTNHRRAADIDVFDRQFERAIGLGNRLLKRIQIHADNVNRLDAVLGQCGHVCGHGATRQNARMNVRVKSLDSPVKHLRKTGVIGHFLTGNAFGGKEFCRSPRRQNVVPEINELSGKRGYARLVRNADECLLTHSAASSN